MLNDSNRGCYVMPSLRAMMPMAGSLEGLAFKTAARSLCQLPYLFGSLEIITYHSTSQRHPKTNQPCTIVVIMGYESQISFTLDTICPWFARPLCLILDISDPMAGPISLGGDSRKRLPKSDQPSQE